MPLLRAARLLALLPLVLTGCGDPPSGPSKELKSLPRPLTAAEAEISSAGNAFTFALFRQVNASERTDNVFLSPLSASMALGMALNGADGSTYAGMRSALAFEGAELAEINQGYKGLIALLRGLDRTTDMRIANSVWHSNEFPVHAAFTTTAKTFFDAKVTALDFSDPAAPATINTWVHQSTAGKIPRIIEVIDPNDVMFLINAIYFKGVWRDRFDPASTQNAPFHRADGNTETVRMMRQKMDARWMQGPDFQAVDLLYGNGAFSMTVLLPDPGKDVNVLAEMLEPTAWSSWMQQFKEEEMYVGFPKLKLEYARTLNEDLKALGMTDAFDDNTANFSRLSPQGVFISFVKQKTFVNIDEEGTEAAAATAVGFQPTSAPPSFTADRPFLFVIRERLTGTILFIGKIARPPVA